MRKGEYLVVGKRRFETKEGKVYFKVSGIRPIYDQNDYSSPCCMECSTIFCNGVLGEKLCLGDVILQVVVDNPKYPEIFVTDYTDSSASAVRHILDELHTV